MPAITYRVSDERKDAIDAARGDIPIQRWLDGIVGQALGSMDTQIKAVQKSAPRSTVKASRVPSVDPLAARQAALNKGKGL